MFLCLAVSVGEGHAAELPGSSPADKEQAENILKRQLEILQEQGFVGGKGSGVSRRLKRLQKGAEKAFADELYEDSALFYYSILENPEFKLLIDHDAVRMDLVHSLEAAGIDYAALDFVKPLIEKGPEGKRFTEAFRMLVDIINRLQEWKAIEPVLADLHTKYPKLPADLRDEANYLYARKAFFEGDYESARSIFRSITPSSRFYLRALYQIGVIAVLQKDLPMAFQYFNAILQNFAKNEVDPSRREIRELTILARARVQYALGQNATFNLLDERAQTYPINIFENAWALFRSGRYAESLIGAEKFTAQYPAHPLLPEGLFLLAHARMEEGTLPLAQASFQRLISRYEVLVHDLRSFTDKKEMTSDDLRRALLRINYETGGTHLLARLSQDRTLKRIREMIVSLTNEEQNLKGSEGAWSGIRTAIISKDKKVFFPGESRIKPFAGRQERTPYKSLEGSKLHEVEKLEIDLKQRQQSVEDALKDFSLEKGRPLALRKSLERERDRLTELQQKLALVHQRVVASETRNFPPTPTPTPAPPVGGVKKFDDLIDQEVALLPNFKVSLAEKRLVLENLSTRFAHKRLQKMVEDLDYLVRSSYLGVIEVAFLQRENEGKDNPQGRAELISLINAFIARYPQAPEIPQEFFRLAELSYEKAKEKYFAEQEAFELEYERFVKGESKTEPKEPKPNYSESIQLCERLLKEYPRYASLDQVYYLLGYYYDEQGDRSKSILAFSTLLEKFPKSDFALESHMRSGENYFEQNEFSRAIASYEVILKVPESIFYEIALYKVAWSYYKMAKFPEATQHFLQLVAYSDKKLKEGSPVIGTRQEQVESEKRLTDLREEAVTYLALCFSEMGGAKEVATRFEQLGMTQYTQGVLRRMATLYFDQMRYGESIGSYRELLEQAPFDPEAPQFQERIIEAYEKMGDQENAFRERQNLANRFGPRSDWAAQNRTESAAAHDASLLVEESLIYSATYYHELAQKDPKPEHYQRALEAYRKYIWEFPDSLKSSEMRFLYAEVLYAVGNYEAAAYHYDYVAAKRTTENTYAQEATLNSVLAYEKVLEKEGVNFQERAREQVKLLVPTEAAALQAKLPAPRELSRSEQNLLTAYDHYLSWAPQGEKVPEITFKSGLLLYQAAHYPEAITRFSRFYEAYPNNSLRVSAANYILNAQITARNWPEVERWGRKLLNDPQASRFFSSEKLRKIVAVSLFVQAQSTQKQGQLEKSAERYISIEKEFSGDPLGATAIYNASANYEKAGKSDLALEQLELLVKRYPKSDLTPKALFQLGKTYEGMVNYPKASQYYEQLARSFPQTSEANDALYNAAIFQELMGKDREAAGNYLAYIRRNPNQKETADLHFLAAKAVERSGDAKRAADLYVEHAKNYRPDAERKMQSLVKAAQAYRKAGEYGLSENAYAQAVSLYREQGTNLKGEGRHNAALARFHVSQATFSRFEAVKLQLPPKRMANLLEEKAKRLEDVKKEYTEIVAIGDPEMATAALYQIGRAYQLFSEALFTAPVPKGLDQEGKATYKAQLEDQAFPIEDKAIEAYEKGLTKARDLHVYSPWTIKILRELRRYRPQKYPPVFERLPELEPSTDGYERNLVQFD